MSKSGIYLWSSAAILICIYAIIVASFHAPTVVDALRNDAQVDMKSVEFVGVDSKSILLKIEGKLYVTNPVPYRIVDMTAPSNEDKLIQRVWNHNSSDGETVLVQIDNEIVVARSIRK